MPNKKPHLILTALFVVATMATAQNSTNSPYTRFGYGELSSSAPGQLRAMGGISTGVRSNRLINPSNPASYTAVDSTTFMFDLAVSGMYSRFNADNASTGKWNANLEYITMQFPMGKHFGFSAGLMPYSTVGYEYGQTDSVRMPAESHKDPIDISYTQTFKGEGGITQVYAGLAGEIAHHVSLGINAYYMWGNIDHYRDLSFISSDYESENIYSSLRISNFRLRFGVQAYHTFAQKHRFTLGFAYEYKNKLGSKYSKIETNSNDTLVPVNTEGQFELPAYYSAGLTYDFGNRISIGVDYSMQQWSKARYENQTDSLQDTYRLGLGFSYRHNPYSRRYVDRISWRLGANLYNTYIKNTAASNFGISFGIGLPLRSNSSMVNATFEYNRHAAEAKGSLQEDLFKLTINASFAETWFFKRKI